MTESAKVDTARDMDGPYSDYRHFTLSGNLIHPATVKAREAEITLMPDRSLNEREREREDPHSCGSLYLHRGHFQALLPMPLDALPSVLQAAIAGRLRYVVMTGDKLRCGQGLARMYRLQRMLDEDDLPGTRRANRSHLMPSAQNWTLGI